MGALQPVHVLLLISIPLAAAFVIRFRQGMNRGAQQRQPRSTSAPKLPSVPRGDHVGKWSFAPGSLLVVIVGLAFAGGMFVAVPTEQKGTVAAASIPAIIAAVFGLNAKKN